MPKPFLFSNLNARQRAAYPYIIRGVREGKTQAQIEKVLRGENLGITHSIMRAMVRHETEVVRYSHQLQLLRPSDKPVARNLPEALTKLTRRYAFTVELRGTLIESGKPIVQHVTLSMNKLMTRGAMEDLARDLVGSNRKKYGMEIDDAVISSGLRAGEEGTL